MSRLKQVIRNLNTRGEKALGVFVTAGYPNLSDTVSIIRALDAGGADFIELGMPFSDPLAEGLPIQMSSAIALSNGVTMDFSFESAAEFRSASDTPLLLMGYVNPVLQYGISNFFDRCHSSGVDAVILPDYPLHSRLPIRDAARQNEIDLVYLVAPTTPSERIRHIDELSRGFVYAVSMTGLTGTTMPDRNEIKSYLNKVRGLCTNNPVLVGFGISTAEDVTDLSRAADGCIVGSAVINKIEKLWANLSGDDSAQSDSNNNAPDRFSQLTSFVADLKSGTT